MRRSARPIPPHLFIALAMLFATIVAPATRGQDPSRAPLAARTLARGDTIVAADIVQDSASTDAASAVIGMITRRIVRAGEPLRAPAIGKPPVIIAGQIVTVRAVFGGLAVTRQGTAQSPAAAGDSVRVRLDARTTVTGIAGVNATVTITR